METVKPFLVAAFYKFVALPDFREMREPLLNVCRENNIKGTILLAHEGINGTISGSDEAIKRVLEYLRRDARLADLEAKFSDHEAQPFQRLKVRLKKEIVTIGLPEISPTKCVGTYVKAQDWNALISQPNVLVLDTRNDYEVEVGTFQNALNPSTHSFRQFPDYVKQNLDPEKIPKVAMFCTGGIRCEKASAFMLEQGFAEVYHLEGGILKYLEEVSPTESLWQGECFVFDERVALDHDLQRGHFALCDKCGNPVPDEEKYCSDCSQGDCSQPKENS